MKRFEKGKIYKLSLPDRNTRARYYNVIKRSLRKITLQDVSNGEIIETELHAGGGVRWINGIYSNVREEWCVPLGDVYPLMMTSYDEI